MNYTRKEITSWVESQTRYKFQQLKNGVFFCRMLSLRFPEETLKFKYNLSPVSEYDALNNLTAMKKILNKQGLQLNLNIHTVLNSKNNFELAKWFKALIDRQISIDTPALENKSQRMSRQPSTLNRMTIESNFSSVQTPRNRLDEPLQNFRKHLESAEKGNKHSNSNVKRLSMAKSQNHFFKEKKTPSYHDIKIPMSRKPTQAKQKLNQTELVKNIESVQKDQDNISTLLYQRALQESIEAFEKILAKVQTIVDSNDDDQFGPFKEKLRKAIFQK